MSAPLPGALAAAPPVVVLGPVDATGGETLRILRHRKRLPREEPALSPEKFAAWLSDLDARGAQLSYDGAEFLLRWPTPPAYHWRDPERCRSNFKALLLRFGLKWKRPPATTQAPEVIDPDPYAGAKTEEDYERAEQLDLWGGL